MWFVLFLLSPCVCFMCAIKKEREKLNNVPMTLFTIYKWTSEHESRTTKWFYQKKKKYNLRYSCLRSTCSTLTFPLAFAFSKFYPLFSAKESYSNNNLYTIVWKSPKKIGEKLFVLCVWCWLWCACVIYLFW